MESEERFGRESGYVMFLYSSISIRAPSLISIHGRYTSTIIRAGSYIPAMCLVAQSTSGPGVSDSGVP